MKARLYPFVAFASSASACPLCHTETGGKVRAALLGSDFWFNAGATILPFAIFLGIVGFLYCGFPACRHGIPKEEAP